MKNVSNNTLLFFYAAPGVTLFLMLIILFFVGSSGTEETLSFIKYMYTESDEKHSFILLNCIMVIWLISAVSIKTGIINSLFRSIIILGILSVMTLLSFLYLGEFIAFISLPALIYGSIYTWQMHNQSLSSVGCGEE